MLRVENGVVPGVQNRIVFRVENGVELGIQNRIVLRVENGVIRVNLASELIGYQ